MPKLWGRQAGKDHQLEEGESQGSGVGAPGPLSGGRAALVHGRTGLEQSLEQCCCKELI